MDRARRLLALAAWVGILVTAIVGLPLVTQAVPVVTDVEGWQAWTAGRDAPDVVFGLAGVALRGIAWYLLGTTIVGAALRLLRAGAAVRYLDVLTIPPVRRLLQFALGLGLATAGLASGGGTSGGPAEAEQAPTAASIALAEAQTAEMGGHADGLRLVSTDGPEALRYLGNVPLDAESAAYTPDGLLAAEDAERTHEVVVGEHFWGIAADVLEQAWDRAPTDAEVLGYWQELIAANEDRLADPGNPDLLFPGQELLLPQAPDAP